MLNFEKFDPLKRLAEGFITPSMPGVPRRPWGPGVLRPGDIPFFPPDFPDDGGDDDFPWPPVPEGGYSLTWKIIEKIEELLRIKFSFIWKREDQLSLQDLFDRYGVDNIWDLLQKLLQLLENGELPIAMPYIEDIIDALTQLLEELLRQPDYLGDLANEIEILREILKRLKDILNGIGSDGRLYRYGGDGYWYDAQGRRYKKRGNDFIPADPIGDPDYVSPEGFPNPYE